MTTFLIALIATLAAALICAEAKAWSPKLLAWIIRRAMKRVPSHLQERMQEEWNAYINEIPGTVGKLYAAAGFVIAAGQLAEPVPLVDRLKIAHSAARIGFHFLVGNTIRNAFKRSRVQHVAMLSANFSLFRMYLKAVSPVILGKRPISYAYNASDGLSALLRSMANDIESGRQPDLTSLRMDEETGEFWIGERLLTNRRPKQTTASP